MASSSQHKHQLFLSLLLVLHPLSAAAQTGPNVTRGSSLSPQGNKPALWAQSPAGDFAFGFVPLQPNQFLLAIWFAKITTNLTVVWSANRDQPVQTGSSASLTRNGRLSLLDHNGQEVWSPGVGDVAYATMLDAGNLALMASDGMGYAWQSFEHPTDTILPTQVMNKGGLLSSRRSPSADDYSVGRFQLRLLPDGNLCLNTIALPTEHAYEAYWLTKGTLGTGSYLVFNQSSGIQEVQENSSLVNVTYANIGSPGHYYQRATLDPDGVFRHYTYPKPATGNGSYPDSWTVASFIPENICSAVIVEKGGSGACGFNSYCQFANNQKACLCPERYSYVDPGNSSKGCMPDFAEPRCDAYDSADFELTAMPNTNWTNAAYEWLSPMQEDECRQSCLEDCRCMVAISKDGDCLKKAMPLSGGRVDPGYGGKSLFKIPRVDSTPPPPGLSRGRKSPPVIVSAMLGCSAFVNILLISAIALLFLSSHRKRSPRAQIDSRTVGGHLQAFSYHTLEAATGKYGEILGKGAFGTVYKGVLTLGEAEALVAVKKLDKLARDGEKEFRAEMNAIGRTHHKNLVQLLGFCDEGPHRLLVYEFMSNGSLASYLFGENKPSWDQRMQIAFGVARGLSYLHEECSSQTIHCDIKPENILLDDCFTARISDFGLAKLLMREQTMTQTDIRGTKGYVAPEWFKKRAITAKVDVYSFGVMLLEIVCCRKNIELEFGSDAGPILTEWAYDCYSEKRLDALVEHDEEARSNWRMLERLVAVALWCIQEEPSMRPSMKKVTQMLEGAVEVSVPPDPTSFISSMY
ncbi:G-type lectin S-receptor-like serine/threonine-protein kinase LECRK2 [Phoenix dactylifera]|uniref:Receptor-like serine/threonine-protein kinase n=1 Tax=Phoenix dactylifera TaxID=42345 RepID=A0A8B8ZL13_PHODC|nr:G-type lectin S-receptor-like serine/threonine-protein kinase LECRK2 [Phoenix dactylifera]